LCKHSSLICDGLSRKNDVHMHGDAWRRLV
jgi:hypothetical protein